MEQKGSLKDRIRFWRLQRKRKKEQRKRKEQQELKQYLQEKQNQGIYIQPVTKKYNLFQILAYSFLGLFLSLLEPKKKGKEEKIRKKIDQEIEALEAASTQEELHDCYQNLLQQEKEIKKKIEFQKQNKVPVTKALEIGIQKIALAKQQYSDLQVAFSANEKKNEKYPRKEFVNQKPNPQSERDTSCKLEPNKEIKAFQQIPLGNEQPKVGEIIISPNKKIKKPKEKIERDKVNRDVVSKEVINVQEKMQAADSSELEPIDKYRKYLMDANQKIKKQKENLKKLKEKIKQSKTPKELYQIESSILWIINQLYFLIKEYEEISKEKEFQYLKNHMEYYTLDKNDLLKNSKTITLLQEECKALIDNIDKIVMEKEHRNQTKKQEPNARKKEEKKPVPYLDMRDFKQLRSRVLNDLNQQMEEIKDIQLESFWKQPTGFFGKMSRFISTTAVCLIPLTFFKNKLTGILTSSILVHNRIRSMRQLIVGNEAIYETGQNLITDIKNKQDCLAAIQNHLTDSYLELQQIRENIIIQYQSLYPVEIENLLTQVTILENQILAKSQSLHMNQDKLIQMKQKYQKVLKKEY